MKRRLLLAAILLALAALVGLLRQPPPSTRLNARVLYRTNDPAGRTRYIISVTNLSRDTFLVQLSHASFTNHIWDPARPDLTRLYDGFDLPSHGGRLIGCEPLPGVRGPAALWYQQIDPRPRWYQTTRTWMRARLGFSSPASNLPQQLFLDLPAR